MAGFVEPSSCSPAPLLFRPVFEAFGQRGIDSLRKSAIAGDVAR
jgi:hypothetical protein